MTTPSKIQNNGFQLEKIDDTEIIQLTPNNGLTIQYDLLTSNPKTFKISSSGINFNDNTNNYISGLERIAAVQQAFSAVELPLLSTNLKVNKTLELNNGVDNALLTINASGNTELISSKNIEINKLTIFNVVPVCSTQPISNIQLTNKQYVDRTNLQLYNNSSVLTTGTPSGNVIALSCPLTLTSGTWICQAQITVINLQTTDSAVCFISNGSSEISNSRGCCGVSLTTSYTNLISNMTIIVVPSATSIIIYPAGTRNGVSQLQLPNSNICGGPNSVISAFRIF